MRVVIDTNVLVSGLRSRNGPSFRLLQKLAEGALRAVVSPPVFLEYEDVLKRPGLVPALSAEDVDDFLDYFLHASIECKVHFLWRPQLSDPNDDMLLELALAGSAAYIVTFNARDFAAAVRFGIRIVTPREFLAILEAA